MLLVVVCVVVWCVLMCVVRAVGCARVCVCVCVCVCVECVGGVCVVCARASSCCRHTRVHASRPGPELVSCWI